jgi:hypothetical protein
MNPVGEHNWCRVQFGAFKVFLLFCIVTYEIKWICKTVRRTKRQVSVGDGDRVTVATHSIMIGP